MVNYRASFVILPILLLLATTARCSWISGGAPPPAVTEGDYVTSPDELMNDDDDAASPGPSNELESPEKDESTPGPSNELEEESEEESSPGPESDIMVQAKNSIESHRKVLISQEQEKDDTFIIQGKVYCDPCRIQFPTKISFPLAGTKVTLVCHKETGEETYRVEGESDQKGKYTLEAVGDHADEICEITVNQSPDPNCPEIMDDENHVRVSLTNKHGAKGKGRYANPLGFMVKEADPRCKEALDELGFTGI
ncbi:anther-specific protein LAT52-like [Rutidosis leptorrhynchoides]|uniref:anther-specific protein LAT52-like n=1 Tax=Rutidosis leptorrhynchoides TaxID=125765 RepID=UPI003A9A2CAB